MIIVIGALLLPLGIGVIIGCVIVVSAVIALRVRDGLNWWPL